MRKVIYIIMLSVLSFSAFAGNSRVYTVYQQLIRANGFKPIPLYIDNSDMSLNASTNHRSITVTSGLINSVTTNELAFVLGHELGHIRYNNGEKGADIASLSLGRRAGYNTCSGGIKYFKRLIRRYGDSGDSAHPRNSIRIKYIQNSCR
jgi:hypothetical protein